MTPTNFTLSPALPHQGEGVYDDFDRALFSGLLSMTDRNAHADIEVIRIS